MRLKLISDGRFARVVNAETGEQVENVVSAEVLMTPGDVSATLYVAFPEYEITLDRRQIAINPAIPRRFDAETVEERQERVLESDLELVQEEVIITEHLESK